jgi:hypothetical protein
VKVALQRVYGPIAKATGGRVVSEPSIASFQRPGVRVATGTGEPEKTRADLGFFDSRERRTVYADVRTATIQTPATFLEIGQTVELAEKAKVDQYAASYKFPEGVSFLPVAIDSYGRWGPSLVAQLKRDCWRASSGNLRVYNRLITNARTQVSIAHARAIGFRLHGAIEGSICIAGDSAVRTALANMEY